MNNIEDEILSFASALLAQLNYPLPLRWNRLGRSLLWSGKENRKFSYLYEIEPVFFSPNEWILTIYTMMGVDNIHINFDTELSVEENVDLYLMMQQL